MFNVKRCARKSKQNPTAYSVQELKEIAKKLLIKGYSTMTKEQLCKVIARVTNKGKNIENNKKNNIAVKNNNNNNNVKNSGKNNNNTKIKLPEKVKITANIYHIVASRICSTLDYGEPLSYDDLYGDAAVSNAFSSRHVINHIMKGNDDIHKQIDKVIANGLIEKLPKNHNMYKNNANDPRFEEEYRINPHYTLSQKGADYLDGIKNFDMVSNYGVDLEF